MFGVMASASQWLFFSGIFKYIDGRLEAMQLNMLNNVMAWVQVGFVTVVSLWIFYQGFMIATGRSREPLAAFLTSALRLAFVVSISMVFVKTSTSTDDSSKNLYRIVSVHMPKVAMGVVTGNYKDDPMDKIDENLDIVAGTFALLELAPQSGGGSGDAWKEQIASSMRLGAMGATAPAVIGGALLLVYKVAMSLFIGFGPLFILFAGFKSTMQLFTKWLYYGIGTMFSMAVLSFMVALVTKITLAVAAAMAVKWLFLLNSGGGGINTIAMQQGGVGLIMSILLLSCPPLAAAFFNATVGQASAYNIFGAGGQQARDANGNPVGNNVSYTGGKTNEQLLRSDSTSEATTKSMSPYSSPSSPTPQTRVANPQQTTTQSVEAIKSSEAAQRGIGAQNEKS